MILLLFGLFIRPLGDRAIVKIEEDILLRMPSHSFIARLMATTTDSEGKTFKRIVSNKLNYAVHFKTSNISFLSNVNLAR